MSEKIWNITGIQKKGVLARFNNGGRKESIVMESITEKEEARIDKSTKYFGALRHELKNGYIIEGKDIYCYGQIDFTSDDDLALIKRLNIIHDGGNNWVETSFDYENGTITSVDGITKGSITWDPVLWAKYNHVKIGKPERIIIYKIRDCFIEWN